jgi:glycerol-3-phosphate dehydrogenase (NAD(P)+)
LSNIAVIGAGAWGTAISIALARQNRHAVSLWAFEREVYESISKRGINELFLPDQTLPLGINVTNSLEDAIRNAQILVSVMPSHHTRRVFENMKPHLREGMVFVSATKGVENETLLRMSEVIREVIAERGWNPRIGAMSGPSFAKEVAKGDPTAITVGSKDADLASLVQREFSDHTFRIYTNDDIVGVELGGALKNVIAIAAGVCDGLGLGHNTIAALITRGLAEIARLAVACGARQDTMAGLAGLGDLVLTCTGGLSRNRTVGVELGKGRKLDEIIGGMHGMVAEGVLTTNAAVGLAKKMNVEMPITEQMYAILNEGKSPKESMHELMTRRGTSEVKLLTADQ